jgi:hypothetical protein
MNDIFYRNLMENMFQKKNNISNWKQFSKYVRKKGCNLLNRLDLFPNSVLVTGCQRSGTTILSRVITQSEGMINFWVGKDDELDAALILSGKVEPPSEGRYCFQTTYLNECFNEYFAHDANYKMIWVLRNPFSVVYSLVYHWKRWPLNELFHACGSNLLEGRMAIRYERYGAVCIPRLIKACLSYNGKVSQLFEIKKRISNQSIMVIEYDDLATHTASNLERIYKFIDLPFKNEYCRLIHNKSTTKKKRLSDKEHNLVKLLCLPVYTEAKQFLDNFAVGDQCT